MISALYFLGRQSVFGRVIALALVSPTMAFAHPADEGAGIQLSIVSVSVRGDGMPSADDDPFDIDVSVYLRNTAGEALTLRGVDAPTPARARILRTVTVLGVRVERETAFIRIDPGESLVLEPPDGVLLIEGVRRSMLEFGGVRLKFDFGPAGVTEALARPPAP